MNERERWIVYPLLFFALGASLRDKFLQHVETKELECTKLVAKEILCEDLSILDPVKDDRIVAKLTSGKPTGAANAENDNRFGVLLLFDSAGQELCGVANNELFVRQIICEAVRVTDPREPTRTLAGLGSVSVSGPDGVPRPFGVLVLNNEEMGTVTGNPPRGVIPPRPDSDAPADPERPPQDGDSGADSNASAG